MGVAEYVHGTFQIIRPQSAASPRRIKGAIHLVCLGFERRSCAVATRALMVVIVVVRVMFQTRNFDGRKNRKIMVAWGAF